MYRVTSFQLQHSDRSLPPRIRVSASSHLEFVLATSYNLFVERSSGLSCEINGAQRNGKLGKSPIHYTDLYQVYGPYVTLIMLRES